MTDWRQELAEQGDAATVEDFRGARPLGLDPPSGAGVRDSVLVWGRYLYPDPAFFYLAWAQGLGLTTPGIYGGEAHPIEGEDRIDPTAFTEIKRGLERGDAWSSVLAQVIQTNRARPQRLALTAWFMNQPQDYLQTKGFSGILPGEGVFELDPGHTNDSEEWTTGTGYTFAHSPAHLVAALLELEADARAELEELEPAGVRALRNQAAAAGRPLSLEDARERFARSHGLSATESAKLKKSRTPMDNTALHRFTRRDSLTRAFGALAGQPIQTVQADPYAAPTSAKVPADAPSGHTTAYAAAGGAVLGAIVGKLAGHSWTGAAVGAGIGALAGGGVAYAMEPASAGSSGGAISGGY